MPIASVFDMTGAKTGEMELNAAVFGIEPNEVVLHAAVKNYLANQRQGTQSTLTRTEVRGGGIKPVAPEGHPAVLARVPSALRSGFTAA